jgi:hypothetical protein
MIMQKSYDGECLVGLTSAETAEFYELSKAVRDQDEFLARRRDARWIELYLKHECARIGSRILET